MKTLLLAICLFPLLLIGCVNTTGTVIYRDGKPVLKTSADATNIRLTANGDFSAATLNHSVPITARANGVAVIFRGAGSAVGEGSRSFVGGVPR